MITSFIFHEILGIISCLIQRMRMQLVPGPLLFHHPAKKAGLGTRLTQLLLSPAGLFSSCAQMSLRGGGGGGGGKCILMVTNTIYLLAGLADKESKLHLPYYYILSIIVSLTNCTAMCRTLVQSGLLRLHIRHLTKLRSSPLTKVSQCFSLLWMSRTRNSKCDTM